MNGSCMRAEWIEWTEWVDAWMHGWWMHGWMDGWMDGLIGTRGLSSAAFKMQASEVS